MSQDQDRDIANTSNKNNLGEGHSQFFQFGITHISVYFVPVGINNIDKFGIVFLCSEHQAWLKVKVGLKLCDQLNNIIFTLPHENVSFRYYACK